MQEKIKQSYEKLLTYKEYFKLSNNFNLPLNEDMNLNLPKDLISKQKNLIEGLETLRNFMKLNKNITNESTTNESTTNNSTTNESTTDEKRDDASDFIPHNITTNSKTTLFSQDLSNDLDFILTIIQSDLTSLEKMENVFKSLSKTANFTFIKCYNFHLEQYKLGFLIEEVISKWKNIYIAEQCFCVLPVKDICNLVREY